MPYMLLPISRKLKTFKFLDLVTKSTRMKGKKPSPQHIYQAHTPFSGVAEKPTAAIKRAMHISRKYMDNSL